MYMYVHVQLFSYTVHVLYSACIIRNVVHNNSFVDSLLSMYVTVLFFLHFAHADRESKHKESSSDTEDSPRQTKVIELAKRFESLGSRPRPASIHHSYY